MYVWIEIIMDEEGFGRQVIRGIFEGSQVILGRDKHEHWPHVSAEL